MALSSSVRRLFSGSSLSTPPEDDEDDVGAGPAPAPTNGPTPAAVNALVATEVNTAVTAANTRWNTVMTSDAGAANPKAAARLLSTSTMAADDIVATLGEFGGKAPTAAEADAARAEEDRKRLAGNPAANPKTGAAGGSPEQRKGEGDDADKGASAKAKAKAAADRRNKAALAKGGKQVG